MSVYKCGSGSSKKVYHRKINGHHIAQIIPIDKSDIEDITNELKIQRLCFCKNIIAVFANEPTCMLVEYMPYALHKWLNKFKIHKTKTIVDICLQISIALRHIHRRGFVHKDIKLENIMINKKGNIVKITDFGLVCMVDSQHSNYGWENYWDASPELRTQNCLVTQNTDIFSFGLILYTLITNESYVGISNAICHNKKHSYLRDIDTSPQLISILRRCLNRNPKYRPSSTELVIYFLKMKKSLFVKN